MSASARNAVCAAIPPTALEKASDASPSIAAVIDTTVPDSDVAIPSSTAPAIASPTPVRSANWSAFSVSRTPTTAITAAVATNPAISPERGSVSNHIVST